MRIRSFRVRIALLSVLCSSLVLLGSALVAGHIMWRSELNRVDQFIGKVVRDNLRMDFMPPPGDHPPGPPPGWNDPAGPPPDGPNPMDMDPEWNPPEWHRPPWMPGQHPRADGDDPELPLSIFAFKDLTNQHELRSENWPASLSGEALVAAAGPSVKFSTLSSSGRLWRVAAGGNGQRTAVFGVDLESAVTNIKQLTSAFLLSIPVALLLIALGAVFMARRALRPVHDLTRLVDRVTARGLGERVTAPVKDAEFEKLILVFNQMMDRLERSFMQATRFSTDAAHELRTPITILQGYLERMIRDVEPGSKIQQDLGEMTDEIHRIKSILEKLLLLARMDAGQIQLYTSPIDLSGLVKGIVEDIHALAPGIAVTADIEPGVHVNADAALLETALQNLSSNAIKYNLEENGRIHIQLRGGQGSTRLAIENTGPAIPAADREKIFERFYRADKSRSREIDGLGLGLSLAHEIVLAHHGRLELVPADDHVIRFEMILPLAGTPGIDDQRALPLTDQGLA